jgi:hypothetical protein
MVILYRSILGTTMGVNVAEVGIEHGAFGYNARCYNHCTMAAYPDLSISGSRSYPKKALAENVKQYFIFLHIAW